MPRRWIALFLVGAVGFLLLALWLFGTGSSEVQSKGDGASPALAYLSLATSVVSLLTAIAGLVKTAMEVKKAARQST